MDSTSFFHELENLLYFISDVGLFILVVSIYFIISIWYNTRQTKVNSDRILRLLEKFTQINMDEEEINEDWIYSKNADDKKETSDEQPSENTKKESIWTKKIF